MKKIKLVLFVLIVNILIISLFPKNSFGQSTSNVNLNFVNNVIFSTDNPNFNGTFNMKNPQFFTQTYNGSYSFTNETDYTNPKYLTIDEGGGSANIFPILSNHRKILELNDTDGANDVIAYIDSPAQAFGSLDLWLRVNDVTFTAFFEIRDGNNQGVYIFFDNENIYYFSGGQFLITSASDNLWYHIRIDFECGGGGYQGLASDTFFIYINGEQFGAYPFFTPRASLNRIRFATGNADSNYKYYIDAIGQDWLSNYSIKDNLVPFIEVDTSTLEVDKYQFSIRTTNILYTLLSDNILGFTDIELGGGDKVNVFPGQTASERDIIISDNTNGATRGTKKDNLQITNQDFINVSWDFTFLDFFGGVNIDHTLVIESSDSSQITNININHNGELKWFDGVGFNLLRSDITSNKRYLINLFFDYTIDSIVLRYNVDGVFIENYHFPMHSFGKSGLDLVYFATDLGVALQTTTLLHSIGVYVNGTSVNTDLGTMVLPFDNPIKWNVEQNNLYTINSNGNYSTGLVLGTEYIVFESFDLLDDFRIFNNNSFFLNLINLTAISVIPLLVFTINGSNFFINSINIEGVQLHNDLIPTSFAWLQLESSNIDIVESFFFVDTLNRLNFNLNTDDTNLEFIKAKFNIIDLGISTDGRAITFTSQINDLAKGQISVLYPSSSNSFTIPLFESKTTILLTQNLTIQWIEVLITDNDIDTILGLTEGYLFRLGFTFSLNIGISIITNSLIEMLIPLLLIVIPTLILSSRLGKQFIVPLFLVFSIIITITLTIPIWLLFVISIGSMVFLLIEKKDD